MAITLTQQPIGITIPIENGNNGFFAQSYDTITQTKTNIINLLNTRQGERRFQPTFGCRLWNITFEQNVDTLSDIANNIISEDISMWIPNVTVLNVTSTLYTSDEISHDQDIYKLDIAVTFLVNMTKQQDTINITINN